MSPIFLNCRFGVRRLIGVIACTILAGCAQGVKDGGAQRSQVFTGTYKRLSECVYLAIQQTSEFSDEDSFRFVTLETKRTASLRYVASSGLNTATVFDLEFAQETDSAVRVDFWETPRAPWVTARQTIVWPVLENCAASGSG